MLYAAPVKIHWVLALYAQMYLCTWALNQKLLYSQCMLLHSSVMQSSTSYTRKPTEKAHGCAEEKSLYWVPEKSKCGWFQTPPINLKKMCVWLSCCKWSIRKVLSSVWFAFRYDFANISMPAEVEQAVKMGSVCLYWCTVCSIFCRWMSQ